MRSTDFNEDIANCKQYFRGIKTWITYQGDFLDDTKFRRNIFQTYLSLKSKMNNYRQDVVNEIDGEIFVNRVRCFLHTDEKSNAVQEVVRCKTTIF